jgi:signal transduction histidine kinase
MPGSHGVDRKKTDPSDQARLRALDAMLGGVAHDLNNALSVVLMNLDVMQADQALAGKHAKRIDGMLDAMTSASTLVRYLLSFSHARRPEVDIMSLSETLPPLVELLEAAVGRDIAVVIGDSEAGPCCIMADAATLEIALAHAAMQLAEAMPSGGTITFALSAGEGVTPILLVIDAAPRGAVEIGGDLDLEFIERFAQDAQGKVLSTVLPDGGRRVAISLPACAEATTL